MQLDRVFKFLASNYGSISGTKFKEIMDTQVDKHNNLTEEAISKLKSTFNTILIKEIARTYKVPNAVSLPYFDEDYLTLNAFMRLIGFYCIRFLWQ